MTAYRVVQRTTGNIGTKSVHAIVANSQLELVGCYAWSKDKVGRDVGELAGIAPLGVLATDDVAGIDVRWRGFVGDRDVVEVRAVWTKGQALEPPDDFVAETIEEYILLGLTITAVPAVAAIPAVVAAPPGIATYNDLPLFLPRGVLSA